MGSIGRTIKGFAVALGIIGGLASVFLGYYFGYNNTGLGSAIGLGGIFAAVFFSFLTAGFGQLVENSDIVAAHYAELSETERIKEEKKEKSKAQKKLEDSSVPDSDALEFTCSNCGNKLFFTKGELADSKTVTCPYCDAVINSDLRG